MLDLIGYTIAFILGYLVWWWIGVTSTQKGVVGTIGLPFLGNALDFLPHKLLTSLEKYWRSYGNIALMRIFNQRVYIISDPTVAREVLMKRPKQFRRSRQSLYTGKILNVNLSLLHASGAMWSRLRRSTAPSFSSLQVSNKVDHIVDELETWVQQLKEKTSQSTEPIEMTKEAFSLTIRVISRVAFGLGPDNPVSSYFFSPTFIQDMKDVFRFTLEFTFRRLPVWIWKLSPWYIHELKVIEGDKRLMQHCQEVIDYKRQQHSKETNSMIDVLIQRQEKDAQDKGLSDEEIIHNTKIFYFAGTDTTGITISWLTYFLAIYPDVQTKVRDEINTLLFKKDKNIDINMVKSLFYTHAVVKETMRLKNAASVLIFELEDGLTSLTLSDGLELLQGDTVWIYIDGILWNEDIFPEAQSFLPERWIVSSPSATDSDTGSSSSSYANNIMIGTSEADLAKMEEAFLAFGSGPRVCPGMNLAVLEAVLATAHLVKHFELSLACDPKEIKRVMSVTSTPSKMPIRLRSLQ